jgi:hypothetical protein
MVEEIRRISREENDTAAAALQGRETVYVIHHG